MCDNNSENNDTNKNYVNKYFELFDKGLIENKNSIKKIEKLKRNLGFVKNL